MARALEIASIVMAVGSAIALYGVSYETRRIEARIHVRERMVERLEADIAVLRAERAYLGRPERIETLARKQGLEPIRERQYLRVGQAFDDGIARMLDQQEPDAPDNETPQR
jgi:cell division protein FtsL